MASLFTRPRTAVLIPRVRHTAAIRDRRRDLVRSVRIRWAPSRLRRVLRARVVRVLLALVLMIGGVSSVRSRTEAAQAERLGWGTTSPAVLVVEPVAAGDPVAGAIRVEDRPAAMVPAGALTAVPADGLARVDLFVGEMLLADRVVGAGGRDGVGVPAGSVAITVALQRAAPLVAAGDLVDLWSTDAAHLTGRRVAQAAVVLTIDGEQLTVAVPAAYAEAVAVASLRPLTLTRLSS